MTFFAEIWAKAPAIFIVSAFSLSLMTAIELILPREKQSLHERLTGLAIWLCYVPVSLVVATLFGHLWTMIGVRPLFTRSLSFDWAGIAALILVPLMVALVYDFFFYWYHRAQHAFAWRFHAVHHSIRELNTVNSYHHVSEPLFQSVFLLLPVSLIIPSTGPTIPAMLIFLHLQATFIHSSSRVDFGPLRLFFCDNRFHRIHHSLEERHFDRNFGAFTTIWDRLFGTAWFPASDEWPATGLAEIDQPRSIRRWLDLPARFRRRADECSTGPAPVR